MSNNTLEFPIMSKEEWEAWEAKYLRNGRFVDPNPIPIIDHINLLKPTPEKSKRFDGEFLGFRRIAGSWNQNFSWKSDE